jgi:hypothetical protein
VREPSHDILFFAEPSPNAAPTDQAFVRPVAGVKAIRKEGKEFLSALETSAVHQSKEPEKIPGLSLMWRREKVPLSDRAEKYAS